MLNHTFLTTNGDSFIFDCANTCEIFKTHIKFLTFVNNLKY